MTGSNRDEKGVQQGRGVLENANLWERQKLKSCRGKTNEESNKNHKGSKWWESCTRLSHIRSELLPNKKKVGKENLLKGGGGQNLGSSDRKTLGNGMPVGRREKGRGGLRCRLVGWVLPRGVTTVNKIFKKKGKKGNGRKET